MGADFFFCTFAIGMKPRVILPVQALLVVGLLSAGLHAQSVGIGTATPDPSARLHIEDNARGLLIPNVALSATNVAAPVTSPAPSLLVYNTNTAGTGATAVTPGFYYWDGSQWVRLASGGAGGGNAWLLTGNAGTNPAVNFLGTTDNNSLRIRVNNQQTFQFNTNFSIQRDAGGNARGQDAVDLQRERSAATQVASGSHSVIGGGFHNTASGDFATVGGGLTNTASGYELPPLAGARSTPPAAIMPPLAGARATPPAAIMPPLAGAGRTPPAAIMPPLAGAILNTASGVHATVGGGERNTASGRYATVGGGLWNTASGIDATVGGGFSNTASGFFATVGGGEGNTASGDFSVVPGGNSNTANAAYNLVFGEKVDPLVTETHRVYFFGDGRITNGFFRSSGFLVINRLDGDHPIHVGTNGTNGSGAHLTTGGAWTNGSSRSFKERFVQYRPAEVLEKILQLPVEGYFYKGTEEYHITPMAEDFYRLFGTGVHEIIETDSTGQLVRRPNPDVDKYLAASDVAGVALLGIQALHEENTQLRQQVSDMRMEDAQLRQRVSDLETENAALRARLERLETLVQKIASTQTSP
jgi:FtsZ-binding cell division protein ZapB